MNAVGKYAFKKYMKEQAKHKDKKVCGKEDPFFELVATGRKGKLKKVKRAIPDYIPEHDAKILADVRSYAYKMDMCLFTFCGIRFGWSSVIGLVPEIGDVADLIIAINLYNKIRKVDCDLGMGTHAEIVKNITADFLLGLVPLLGDLADAGYKCNTKNAVLLAKVLDEHYAKDKNGKNLDDVVRKRASRQLFEDDPDFAQGPPPDYYEPTPEEIAAANAPGESGRGWFGGLGRREPVRDPEVGART